MSFNLVVKVDTSQALPAVKAVEQGLDKSAKSATGLGAAARTAMNDAKLAAERAAAAAAKYNEVLASGLDKSSAGYVKAKAEAVKAAEAAAEAQRKATEAQRAMGEAMAGAGANAFGKMIAQFEREADVLERIRGPIREYYADLVALDALHRKGAISAAEFATEMERLTKGRRAADAAKAAATIGLGPAPSSGPGLGAIAGGVQVATGAAAALGVYEITGKVRELVEHFQYLRDAYILASNAAVKFVDSTHDVKRIMNEQLVAANELHSNYHTTIEIYDTVRDGIDELSFSHREQIRILETLGKASQIAGKSLGSVGGIVERLAYAAARGTIEQRELNTIMRQVPDIAQLWTEKFGVSRKELLSLVQQGKIGTVDLIDALVSGADTVDRNFKKIQRTERQRVDEVIENMEMLKSAGDTTGEALAKALDISRGLKPVEYRGWQGMIDAAKGLRKTWADLAIDFQEKVETMMAAWERMRVKFTGNDIVKAVEALSAGLSRLSTSLQGFAVTVGTAMDPWGEKKTGFLAEFSKLRSIKGPIDEAKTALRNLQAIRGQLTGAEFRAQYEQLVTTINDGRLPAVIKLWHELNDPIREAAESIGALNTTLRGAGIEVGDYNGRVQTIAESMAKWRHEIEEQNRAVRGVSVGARRIGGVDLTVYADRKPEEAPPAAFNLAETATAVRGEATPAMRELNQEYARQFDVAGQGAAAELEYERAIQAVNGAQALHAISQERANLLTEQAKDRYQSARDELAGYASIVEQFEGPSDRYENGIRAAGAAFHDQRINADQYADAIDRIRAAYLASSPAGKTFMGGIDQYLLRSKMSAQSLGETISTTLINDFEKLNDALVTAAHNGEVSWGKMVDAMIQDLERLILKQLEVAAINAIITAATGAPVPGAGQVIAGNDPLAGFGARTAGVPAYPTVGPASTATISGRGATVVNNKIVNVLDKSQIYAAMDSPEGERIQINQMRRNGSAVRSYSGTRR